MPPIAEAVLASWSFPPWVTALNLLAAMLYIRGWAGMHHLVIHRFTHRRLFSFLAGIAILEVALASPIDTFDPFFLTDHMLQHMLLMMIVPPLVLLGDPVIPLLHGLPRWASRYLLGPLFRSRALQAAAQVLTHPALALILMSVVMIGWHLPHPYELALHSSGWHEIEHAFFLFASFLFWWPVVQPWPSKPRWDRWALPVYLLLADFVNSALSAFLTFSDRVFYPSYALMPRLGGISAHNDQVAAGAMMWVIGSFAFLVPAVLITARILSPKQPEGARSSQPIGTHSRAAPATSLALCLILPVAALGYAFLTSDNIDIDGDVIRIQADSGPFHMTVFSPPDPLPKNDLELAVLVQNRDTQTPVLDAGVEIEMQLAQSAEAAPVKALPSRNRATNKLLAVTSLDLPRAGDWNLQISVENGKGAVSIADQIHILGTASD